MRALMGIVSSAMLLAQQARYPSDPAVVLATPLVVRSMAVEPAQPGFIDIAQMASVVMGIELIPQGSSNPLPGVNAAAEFVLPPSITVAGALERLENRFPGYSTASRDGVVNIAPARLLDDPSDFLNLNAPVDKFEVRDVSLRDAIVAWRKLCGANLSLGRLDSHRRPF